MATSRRLSNGRSPFVNPRSQITSFFSPGKSQISPSPSISLKESPNPNPTTPQQTKQKKPHLVVRPTPAPRSPTRTPSPKSVKKSYSGEVVGKRIRVFWPLDKSWYEGCVKSFDEQTGKHVVQYDDAEEEGLDLAKEKIKWVQDEVTSFRRLRRNSACDVVVVEKEVVDNMSSGDDGDDDDSMDEDWGKNVGNEKDSDDNDDDSEELEMDEDDEGAERSRRGQARSSGSRKRKKSAVEELGSAKKGRISSNGKKGALLHSLDKSVNKAIQPASNAEGGGTTTHAIGNTLIGDAAERFGRREVEKFGFLGSNRKDACGRLPGDVNYDPRTLYLPPNFLKSLSGGQRQWWDFKSKHMDKVIFFKMGKFYELFEMDAHVGAKELDLQYMKGEQPHCGFPEKNFSMNVEKLARKGYRVLVVEQTETPEQLDLRRKETGSKDRVVKREICAVVTKGTLTEGEMLSVNPDSSYLMSVTEILHTSGNQKEDNTILGVCLVDVSTSRFILGQFVDDSERHCLCSILSELRPVEIIKPIKVLSHETESVLLKNTRSPIVNDLIPSTEFWDAEKTVDEIRNIYALCKEEQPSGSSNIATGGTSMNADTVENGAQCLPDILCQLMNAGNDGCFALSAFGGCLFYLRQAFLDETLLRFAKFELLPCSGFLNTTQKLYMSLDASALENLEILENNINGGSSGTLLSQLDHCVTAFGKRLLKNWLARPLYDAGSIVERQDAIVGLKGVAQSSALEFQKELYRLPDMERLLARLFASCEANGRNANRVVLYEDASKKQLQEFIAALRGCELMAQACSTFSAILESSESSVLTQLLTPGKGLPDIYPVLEHFKDAFDWSEADLSGRIIPNEGVDSEYDSACESVGEIETNLSKHLKDQHKIFGCNTLKYVTVGKDEYLLEVPDTLQGKIPREYELQSSKKGYFRYWTPKIKKLLAELSQAKDEKESKLKNILQRLIGQFCEHHVKWRQLVSTTAELDVLISLAVASDYFEGPTCRPTIIDTSCLSRSLPCFSAKSLGHPVLRSDALGKSSFVPNDVNIGGAGHPRFILLTGPNMGGKSTLLRQICLAVILAQIGVDVPAESFELSPVDRVFVRMGARDHIIAGQSTFLTELSETAAMLSSATHNSLVALDELGRGTSTSDGQAIAESVLEHFACKIQCRGIFSTHYHRLSVDYEKNPQVSLCHMACQVGKGAGGGEEVTFLYRLTPGACPKSYGVNVARLAGLPATVLQKAAAKSHEFEAIYGKNGHGFYGERSRDVNNDEMATIREILHVATASSCSKEMGMGLLSKLQERVKLLLQAN